MSNIVNETRFEGYLRNAMRIFIVAGAVSLIVLMFILRTETKKAIPTVKPIVKTDIHAPEDSGKISFSTSSTKIKLAFTGDQGLTNDTKRALTMIREEGAQALVLLGDFDYQDKPDTWSSMLDTYLGKDFPVVSVMGNHEEKAWLGYSLVAQKQIEKLPKDMCSFKTPADIGLHYSCKLGPVSIVMSAPDINIENAKKVNSAKFMEKELIQFDTTWKLCAWHKPHKDLQLGVQRDNIGWDLYTTCQKAGAYILTGHDHSYARTKTMSDFANKVSLDSASEDVVLIGNGFSGAIIAGLGGRSIHKRGVNTGPWWANTYSAENLRIETQGRRSNIAGVLFCTFEKGKTEASCYFKMTDGKVIDVFTLKRI